MSIHKLTAGSGYDYLTRQVAALDATERGHIGLASYYAERGEAPGNWVGSGMAGIDGLAVGDVVTEEQMRALFGAGLHPLAAERQAQLSGDDLTEQQVQTATRLGAPFRVYSPDVSAFRGEVAKRIAAVNRADGLAEDWPIPAVDRARIRTEVATEFFRVEHGRNPKGPRELAGIIAKHSRPRTQAVAGYDLTFSPVKSVSALWAVSDPPVAAAIERAHQAAVADTLRFVERCALFTRLGANGVRQVEVRGLVAAAFTHRDSRSGDPDLHTHVAVANKVQTLDGRWLSIDGRVLFKANVAASETYNTALEKHLRDALGLRFAERPNPDPRKRPIREIVGVDPALNSRWSARRASIETRRAQLATQFQSDHGRPPTPVEALRLAQQATLETRDAKHRPRSLAEQRATWHAEAVEVLGSTRRLAGMINAALHPRVSPEPTVDHAWLKIAAGRVLEAMERTRAVWQIWHVWAEAQRQIRSAAIPTEHVDTVVDQLVSHVLNTRSVRLGQGEDPTDEPATLRRSDGASVYTVAGADLFTSRRVLAAEQHLVELAARNDGRRITDADVSMALLEAAANGLTLNAGQVALVRAMATSGARLQLAIAPAGTGKTTALRVLARAWTECGGMVIGLAPSAAAAAQLRDQIGGYTDTLAKLTWSLTTGSAPDWVSRIGPETLVVIDESGMADTLSLHAAVDYVVGRGGSVRLVGDDQQLAAIGAGGVLRDIQHSHGAVRLTELLRFTDPAEAGATLALRDGRPEAIGFYLDQDRLHVGDLATLTEQLFTAWQADRAVGLDAIMLAPTRELVADLNARARTHCLNSSALNETDGRMVRLADGNVASLNDLVITRANDRRLTVSRSDWVKNGDRWIIRQVTPTGALRVQHTRHRRTIVLPATYVAGSVELGYATTVHTAQGVTADTMHGLATGEESRQQLYTMLTRGRTANHLYLQVVGDGDPHSLIRPETVLPSTPTELVEAMLARDDAACSASTRLRQQLDPAPQLGEATSRYVDALHVAAEDLAGPATIESLEAAADDLVPGIAGDPAWPVLRGHLLMIHASGADPIPVLRTAARARELDSADDRAAVLDWRLDDTSLHHAGSGLLPWIPGIPGRVRSHPLWGPYLTARAELVADLSTQVRVAAESAAAPPVWAHSTCPDWLVRDVQVWRAAMQVDPDDLRPTGSVQLPKAARRWQRHLDAALATGHSPAWREWGQLIHTAAPSASRDSFAPVVADRLAAAARAGIDAAGLLRSAVAAGPLPDDHAAAALWWRVSRHLSPSVAVGQQHDQPLAPGWTTQLADLLGADQAAQLQDSRWWPALVTATEHSLRRGWQLADLLTDPTLAGADEEPCQTLLWRISVLLDPIPDGEPYEPFHDTPPPDVDQTNAPSGDPSLGHPRTDLTDQSDRIPGEPWLVAEEPHFVEADLAVAAMVRELPGRLQQSEAEVERMFARADAWRDCPSSRDRMLQINQLALRFYRDRFPSSWGRPYLTGRLGVDLADDCRFQPGHAPAGWTILIDHLRGNGVSEQEMLAVGVASVARTGRLIDRFRNRLIFPILSDGEVLGFVGRRHPDLTDADRAGPKYLNTPDTPLFHKGAQLYGLPEDLADATPVLVEGPVDAIAVTVAGRGRYVGVAPLGTSLTDEQAAQLARKGGRGLVVATDSDIAGQVAAERAFWQLAPHGLDPTYAALPPGSDPADLLTRHGRDVLLAVLEIAGPLGAGLLEERLLHLPPGQAQRDAITIVAAQPPSSWDDQSARISSRLDVPIEKVRCDLLAAVKQWNADPRRAAQSHLQSINEVKIRLAAAAIAGSVDARAVALTQRRHSGLVTQPDGAATPRALHGEYGFGQEAALGLEAAAQVPLSPSRSPEQGARLRTAGLLANNDQVGRTTRNGRPQHPVPMPRRDRPTDRPMPR